MTDFLIVTFTQNHLILLRHIKDDILKRLFETTVLRWHIKGDVLEQRFEMTLWHYSLTMIYTKYDVSKWHFGTTLWNNNLTITYTKYDVLKRHFETTFWRWHIKNDILFFSGNYGRCMENKPRRNFLDRSETTTQFPGQQFNENKQCEFVFGTGSKICSYMVFC